MNTSTSIAERGADQGTAVARPAETVRQALEKMRPQFAMALPKHLTPDRLLRVAMTAIQNTPKLLECDRTSLYSAIMTCAQLGLEPDGVLGQAYLVPFAGKVQFIPGYRGLITLARNSGEVLSIIAHEVCANDLFGHWNERTNRYELNMAAAEPPGHIVPEDGPRGEIKRFYAIARFRDGGCHWDAMTRADVDAVRDGSKGYQAAKRFAKNGVVDSPWTNNYPEMGKKTVIRRIAKFLPMNVQKAATMADSYDAGRHATLDTHGDVVVDTDAQEVQPSRQIAHGGSKLERFEEEQTGQTETIDHDPATGEIIADGIPSLPPSPLAAKKGTVDAAWLAWERAASDRINAMPQAEIADFLSQHDREFDEMAKLRPASWQAIEAIIERRKEAD